MSASFDFVNDGSKRWAYEIGTDWIWTLTIKDSAGDLVDVSGWTATCEIFAERGDTSALVTLTSAGGDMTMGGAAGTIAMNAAPADMVTTTGIYWARVTITESGGDIRRLVEGDMQATK